MSTFLHWVPMGGILEALSASGAATSLSAAHISSTSENFTAPDTAALSSSIMSFNIWVKRDSTVINEIGRIIGKWGTSGQASYTAWWAQSTGKITFAISFNGTSVARSVVTAALSEDTWYMITGVFTGSSLEISVNAGTPVTTSATGSLKDSSDPVSIGTLTGTPGKYFGGDLCFVDLYDDALTGTNKTDLYNLGKPICRASRSSELNDSNNVASWELASWSGNTSNQLVDQTGLGNTLTNNGSTPFTGTGLDVECA